MKNIDNKFEDAYNKLYARRCAIDCAYIIGGIPYYLKEVMIKESTLLDLNTELYLGNKNENTE